MLTTQFDTVRPYWFEAVETFPGESAPAGAQLESSMDGGETLADTSLACRVLIEALAPGKSMQAEFAALAPYDEHIRVFNGATEIYNGSSPGQPVVTFEHWPQRIRQEIVSGLPQQELQFDSPSIITVNGLVVGSGDRIVIDPEGLALTTINTFSRHRVRVKEIDSVYTYPRLSPTLVSIAGSGSFGGATSFATGLGPRSVDAGDLNGDGHPDVVVANSSDQTVSVLFGDGSGGLGPKIDLPTGADPRSVAIGDVNGDGDADLVVADHADSKISVLLGGGPGGFGSALDYPTAPSPSAVAIVDLNGDGRRDVVVACGGLGGSVSVLLATAFGDLGPKTDYPVGDFPTALAVGEVNGDWKPDIVVANSGSNTVSLLPGDGIGGFGPGSDFPAGPGPRSVALADMNLDGYPDLVVAGHSSGTISVLLGFGPGSFGPGTSFAVGGSPVHLSVADLNGDENPDIGIANPSAGTASVLFGDGLGGVQSTIAPITGAQPYAVAFSDLNHDGTLDMVEADGAGWVSVVLGQGGSISPAGAQEFAAGDSPLYVIDPAPGYAIADVLVDGVSKGPIGSYSFNGVTQRHTVTARFSSLLGVGSPTTPTLVLSGVQPNPSRGNRLEVHFALSSASRARLELLDISGRLVVERQVGSLGPGRHTVSLSPSRPLEPGIYWIRLSQSSHLRAARLACPPGTMTSGPLPMKHWLWWSPRPIP